MGPVVLKRMNYFRFFFKMEALHFPAVKIGKSFNINLNSRKACLRCKSFSSFLESLIYLVNLNQFSSDKTSLNFEGFAVLTVDRRLFSFLKN